MNVREKLMKLLITAKDLNTLSRQADFLVANGVTVQGAADNRPHGRWVNKEVDELRCHVYGNCSVCHEKKRIDNYCPNCGAPMDLVGT